MIHPSANMQGKWLPILIALMVLDSGCSNRTMIPVADTDDSPHHLSIAIGDTVRVLTKHGDRPTFKVTDITESALIGRDQTIRYDDMAFVEKWSRKRAGGTAATVSLLITAYAVTLVEVLKGGPGLGP